MTNIGKNNNLRGKAFEKVVAKALGWNWIGSVRYSMTPGDVMDAFLNNGFWIGECKTQVPGKENNISVKDKWIQKLRDDGNTTNRLPVFFLTTKGHQSKYALVEKENFDAIMEGHAGILGIESLDVAIKTVEWETKVRGNGEGFVLLRTRLKLVDKVGMGLVVVHPKGKKTGDPVSQWYIFTLDAFKTTIDEFGLYVRHDATEHHP